MSTDAGIARTASNSMTGQSVGASMRNVVTTHLDSRTARLGLKSQSTGSRNSDTRGVDSMSYLLADAGAYMLHNRASMRYERRCSTCRRLNTTGSDNLASSDWHGALLGHIISGEHWEAKT